MCDLFVRAYIIESVLRITSVIFVKERSDGESRSVDVGSLREGKRVCVCGVWCVCVFASTEIGANEHIV